jgi:hypothetical protein
MLRHVILEGSSVATYDRVGVEEEEQFLGARGEDEESGRPILPSRLALECIPHQHSKAAPSLPAGSSHEQERLDHRAVLDLQRVQDRECGPGYGEMHWSVLKGVLRATRSSWAKSQQQTMEG